MTVSTSEPRLWRRNDTGPPCPSDLQAGTQTRLQAQRWRRPDDCCASALCRTGSPISRTCFPVALGGSPTWSIQHVEPSPISTASKGLDARPLQSAHQRPEIADRLHARNGQTDLATVSKTVASSMASRPWRLSGMMIKSPRRASHEASSVHKRTRPRRTRTVASPGFSCSPSLDPSVIAMTVCRRTFSCPPHTVRALCPPGATAAAFSSSRARASSEVLCMEPVWSE